MRRYLLPPSWRAWALPPLLVVLGAPLWLHVHEPALFLALNAACRVLPDSVWTGLSMVGNGWGVLALTAPLLIWAPRLMWAWVCAAPFAALFSRLGKELLVSARPAGVLDPAQFHIVGEVLRTVSMPSGHTTTAFAVASGMYLTLTPAQKKRHSWLFLLAAGCGLSRIAVGAHWPGDVVVGAALGLLAGLLGQHLLLRLPARVCDSDSLALRLLAALVVLSAYVLLGDPLDFAENRTLQYLFAGVALLSVLGFALRSVRRPHPG